MTRPTPRLSLACGWLLLASLIVVGLYIASIGPMTPILRYNGSWGEQTWEVVYGRPLGKLPRPLRRWVNRYMGRWDTWYMRRKLSQQP